MPRRPWDQILSQQPQNLLPASATPPVNKHDRVGDADTGRPGFWTFPDKMAKLKAAFSKGATISMACSHADIHPSSYYDWRKAFPENAWQLEKEKESTAVQILSMIIDKIYDTKNAQLGIWFIERNIKEYIPSIQNRLADAEGEKLDLPKAFLEAVERTYGPGSTADPSTKDRTPAVH